MADPSSHQPDRDEVANLPIGPLELAAAESLQLGEVELRFATLEIVRDGQPQRVAPKAMAILLALAQRAGETVSHDLLLDLVWTHDEVTPDVLSRGVRDLRRALGDASPAQSVIQTIPRIGYRLRDRPSVLRESAQQPKTRAPELPQTTLPTQERLHRRPMLAVAMLAALLLMLGIWWANRPPTEPVEAQTTVTGEQIVVSTAAAEYQPALSPDGRWLAYIVADPTNLQRSRVMIAAADGSQARPLNDMPLVQEAMPQWANDGRRLAYLRSDENSCQVMIARPLDEPAAPPRALTQCSNDNYYPVAWAAGDQGLWLSRPRIDDGDVSVELAFVDLNGDERPFDYQRAPSDLDHLPRPSPDGRWLVFRRGNGVRGDLHLVSTQGGPVRRLTRRDGYFGRVAWYPQSDAIVYSRGAMVDRLLFHHRLADDQVTALNIRDADQVEIAAGKLVFERLRQRAIITEYQIDPDTSALLQELPQHEFAPSTGSNYAGVYSPDGGRVAFISDRSGSQQLWLRDADGAPPRRLTDWPAATLMDLSWSGDGQQLTLVRVDDQRRSSALLLSAGAPGPISLDQTLRLPLPQRVVGKPRLLADGQLAWMARFDDGWQAFIAPGIEGPFDGPAVADLRALELVLQVDGDRLYLTDPVRGEILRVDPPYRQARIVASGLSRWIPGRWRLATDAVWYVWLDQDQGHSLLYRARLPGPLDPQPVLSLGALRTNPVFEISQDARRVLVRGQADDQTDIAMVNLPQIPAQP